MSRKSKNKMDPVLELRVNTLRKLVVMANQDRERLGYLFTKFVCGCMKVPCRNSEDLEDDAYDMGWKARVNAEDKLYRASLRSEITTHRKWFIRNMIESGHDYECIKCGSREGISIDHIKPIACGGNNELYNLQFLCRRCNSKKGSR